MRCAWRWGVLRFFLVTLGIVALTSFSIDATDTLRGSQTALSQLADRWLSVECQSGTVPVPYQGAVLCVDVFTVSPGSACPHERPATQEQTTENINTPGCIPEPVSEAYPWTWVAQHQAESLCARAGKRLLTATEWYQAALGTPDSDVCNTHGREARLSGINQCVSGAGVYDMIGNVWELVAGEVIDRTYHDQLLPESGYIAGVNATGMPTESTPRPEHMFNYDYVWTHASGTRIMMRGGYYGSGSDGGLYALHAAIEPTFVGNAIGFRCVYEKP